MNFFASRNRRPGHSPAAGGHTQAPSRLSDPIAQAMAAADRRSADVMWFGGVTFRKNGGARWTTGSIARGPPPSWRRPLCSWPRGPAAAVDAADAGTKLITGKQVKNNTIDSRDIKDGSLTAKDFKKGVLGSAGIGAPSSPGSPGENGAQGQQGAQGERGPQGLPGPHGERGPQGPAGPQGDAGPQGPAGKDGTNGQQGPKGDKGDKGDPGTPAPPEAYRIVGTQGQPVFAQDVGFGGYLWFHANDNNVNKVAFYKDAFGVVHLKGKAKCVGTTCDSASLIYRLPEGYRPAQQQIFPGLSDKTGNGAGVLDRINVTPDGWVSRAPAPLDSQWGWVSMDGITFRAEQ
jgi:hypothetical protein